MFDIRSWSSIKYRVRDMGSCQRWTFLFLRKNKTKKKGISGVIEISFHVFDSHLCIEQYIMCLVSESYHDSGCDQQNSSSERQRVEEVNTPSSLHGTVKAATTVCCPTEEADDSLAEDIQPSHPVDDFVAVKLPEFRGSHDDGGRETANEIIQTTSTVQAYQSCALIKAVHPLTKENELQITDQCQQLVPAKKEFDGDNPDYNDDEYLYIVRGITSIPHDFAPERVVTPVYTVPRYPDNHNPLLPLSLQKKQGKDIRPHWYYI